MFSMAFSSSAVYWDIYNVGNPASEANRKQAFVFLVRESKIKTVIYTLSK
jgi:hypothetical protein